MSFDPINFTIAAPLLALAAGALVILLFDLLMDVKAAQPWWYIMGIAAICLSGGFLAPLWGAGLKGFGGALVMDQFTLVFAVTLLAATFMTFLLSVSRGESDKSGYLALVLWAAMGMIVMAGAGTLMTIFLGLELLSLALYVAVAFDPAHPQAREAALKYFVLGSVASAFILFGFALIYGVTGTMDLSVLAKAAPAAVGTTYYKVGIGLSLVGFAFKLALVPFHSWAPDVYQGAPTPTTAFMSVGTKGAAFATLARFLIAAVPGTVASAYLLPLSVLAGLSMFLGSMVGIWQTDLKRLMAYSGIAHAGYMIMAIPGLGADGVSAAAYYLAAYCVTAMGIFAIITLLEFEGENGSDLSTFRGLYFRRPGLAAAMALLMFALAGLPPTGGFVGKFLLAKAAVGANAWLLLSALMLSTGISAYVYLRVIGTMFNPEGAVAAPKPAPMAGAEEGSLAFSGAVVRFAVLAVLAIGVVGTLWLGILPGTAVPFFKI